MTTTRVNITIPKKLLQFADRQARRFAKDKFRDPKRSRSGYINNLILEAKEAEKAQLR